jgi:AcrR family transcriptional regulator
MMGMDLGKEAVGVAGSSITREAVVRDDTRERILEAALAVLREFGHGQFSVQKVARHAGVYQGNITYYWPRRRDLVRALATRVVEEYRRGFLAHTEVKELAPDLRAHALVRAMVDDAVTQERIRLLPELWSMANADPDIAQAMTRCFDEVSEALLEVIGAAPDRPCSGRVLRAFSLVGVAVQGLTAVHGHRSPGDPMLTAVKEGIVELHAPLLAAALADCED